MNTDEPKHYDNLPNQLPHTMPWTLQGICICTVVSGTKSLTRNPLNWSHCRSHRLSTWEKGMRLIWQVYLLPLLQGRNFMSPLYIHLMVQKEGSWALCPVCCVRIVTPSSYNHEEKFGVMVCPSSNHCQFCITSADQEHPTSFSLSQMFWLIHLTIGIWCLLKSHRSFSHFSRIQHVHSENWIFFLKYPKLWQTNSGPVLSSFGSSVYIYVIGYKISCGDSVHLIFTMLLKLWDKVFKEIARESSGI